MASRKNTRNLEVIMITLAVASIKNIYVYIPTAIISRRNEYFFLVLKIYIFVVPLPITYAISLI